MEKPCLDETKTKTERKQHQKKSVLQKVLATLTIGVKLGWFSQGLLEPQ